MKIYEKFHLYNDTKVIMLICLTISLSILTHIPNYYQMSVTQLNIF